MDHNRILVLGLGNIIYQDEGVGVAALKELEKRFPGETRINFLDGGTQGLNLLPFVEEADYLLLLDAVDPGDREGDVFQFSGEELPLVLQRKMSAHQVGMLEVLSLAQLHGRYPRHLVLIGVVPRWLNMGMELSPEVQQLLPKMVAQAEAVLQGWLKSLAS